MKARERLAGGLEVSFKVRSQHSKRQLFENLSFLFKSASFWVSLWHLVTGSVLRVPFKAWDAIQNEVNANIIGASGIEVQLLYMDAACFQPPAKN